MCVADMLQAVADMVLADMVCGRYCRFPSEFGSVVLSWNHAVGAAQKLATKSH